VPDDAIVLAQIGCGYWGPKRRAFGGLPGGTVKCVAEPLAALAAERRRS
jgi:hypothetical protein